MEKCLLAISLALCLSACDGDFGILLPDAGAASTGTVTGTSTGTAPVFSATDAGKGDIIRVDVARADVSLVDLPAVSTQVDARTVTSTSTSTRTAIVCTPKSGIKTPRNGYRLLVNSVPCPDPSINPAVSAFVNCSEPVGFSSRGDFWCCARTINDPAAGGWRATGMTCFLSTISGHTTAIRETNGNIALCSKNFAFMGWDCTRSSY